MTVSQASGDRERWIIMRTRAQITSRETGTRTSCRSRGRENEPFIGWEPSVGDDTRGAFSPCSTAQRSSQSWSHTTSLMKLSVRRRGWGGALRASIARRPATGTGTGRASRPDQMRIEIRKRTDKATKFTTSTRSASLTPMGGRCECSGTQPSRLPAEPQAPTATARSTTSRKE
jgi:hypothetical protein